MVAKLYELREEKWRHIRDIEITDEQFLASLNTVQVKGFYRFDITKDKVVVHIYTVNPSLYD